jgi:Fe-S cluster biogenesis protein NfuA
VNREAVDEVVDEMGALLRSDGADLTLVDADPKTARIELQLELDGAECAECVLPADLLEQMISEALSRRVPGEFELVLHDPRRGVGGG